jgi:hypothetical protein
MKKLSVWVCAVGVVAAYSEDDALSLWEGLFRGKYDLFDGKVKYVFTEVADSVDLSIFDRNTKEEVTMKAYEWVALNGRGLLCISEF